MAEGLEREEHEGTGGSFMMGLLTGTVLGAGLGILLAPKSGRELRHDIGEQASSLGRVAGEQFRRATDAAGGMVARTRESVGHAGGEAREAIEQSGLGSRETPGVTYTGDIQNPTPTGGSTYTGSTDQS